MPETIMPGFDRFTREGDLIGRILAGYGELELEMAQCALATNRDLDKTIRALFGIRGELKRIKVADSMMKASYAHVGLRIAYEKAIRDMDFCRMIRNQYAHCNWYDTVAEGLCFVDLEQAAISRRKITNVTRLRRPIDASLLERQEGYLKYVQKCFWYLQEAYKMKVGTIKQQLPLFARPKIIARPRRHN